MGRRADGRGGAGAPSRVWWELLEAAAVVAAFVGFGLAWAVAEREGSAAAPPYAQGMGDPAARIWLVDGYNVLCAGLLGGRERDGWWRQARREELLSLLERFDGEDAQLWVVFDGSSGADSTTEPRQRVQPIFAPSADEWLVEEVRRRAPQEPVCLVTADRRLAGRARHRGARVVPPSELIRRCTS